MDSPLKTVDTTVWNLLEEENARQRNGIELIASENFTSQAVMDALGSVFTNKYAEGLPGRRYYGGNEVVDRLETLCQERALAAFHCDPEVWTCNVQPYSGSVANAAVYLGLLKPHDRIMGLDLPAGGHLSHGYTTPTGRRLTASATYYESIPYTVDASGFLDYDEIEKLACCVKPRLLICGASAYSRDWNYERLRKIADRCGALLMADIAHISGFVATGLMLSPFNWCDVVTTTTHKTLRGPRSAIIFCKRTLQQQINDAVFPGLQGGPHMNQIAAVAVQLQEVMTKGFKKYMQQVLTNSRTLCQEMQDRGYTIVTGGTDNHLFLVDLKNKGINGARAEKVLEHVGISVNKNTIPGDKSALSPSGIRIGVPAVTTRGMLESDMKQIAQFIDAAIKEAVQLSSAGSSLQEFVSSFAGSTVLQEIKKQVEQFAGQFVWY
jgi:glycine hydroxymethyltransferase